jgi:hypothetical protein
MDIFMNAKYAKGLREQRYSYEIIYPLEKYPF